MTQPSTMQPNDTIAALATGTGGAIAVIRLSGSDAIDIGNRIFESTSGKNLKEAPGFTLHYGRIRRNGTVLDDVLLSLFRAPRSYTGENMVEISCHASSYIIREILALCTEQGARSARPGEFTLRAFLSGKMDLSQAEAVADLIAADSRSSHKLADTQMRGGYSNEFTLLRNKLIELSSLLELELDFSEEDVEFADRTQLHEIISEIENKIERLTSSFSLGNIIKNGVPVAIVGKPNVGKSTLLNALLNEEKALVSNIAGTTRDLIEDTINIRGVNFRFIDTAGLRKTDDPLENLGIERTYASIRKASVILLVADAEESADSIRTQIDAVDLQEGRHLAVILNKIDRMTSAFPDNYRSDMEKRLHCPVFCISAKQKIHIDTLTDFLYRSVGTESIENEIIVCNARHYEALNSARQGVIRARHNLSEGISGDLLAQDIREILYHIGTITGEITTDEILGSIFSKFCIGK